MYGIWPVTKHKCLDEILFAPASLGKAPLIVYLLSTMLLVVGVGFFPFFFEASVIFFFLNLKRFLRIVEVCVDICLIFQPFLPLVSFLWSLTDYICYTDMNLTPRSVQTQFLSSGAIICSFMESNVCVCRYLVEPPFLFSAFRNTVPLFFKVAF